MRSQVTRKNLSATDNRNLRTLLLLNAFEDKEIGRRIAQARNIKGLRQEDLAPLIGVSTRSIQGYELGEVSPYKHLRAISEVLGRPVEWFLHGDEPIDPERFEALVERLELLVARLEAGQAEPPNG
jgi:transcriptional regulator with XRE-family HTH domain